MQEPFSTVYSECYQALMGLAPKRIPHWEYLGSLGPLTSTQRAYSEGNSGILGSFLKLAYMAAWLSPSTP